MEFYSRKSAFEQFKKMRAELNDALENPRGKYFSELFSEIKKKASEGDVVAQDVVAYFYRDGAGRFLSEDYSKYMSWQILAAAGGNEFAIDKLQFFLGYAYDTIVERDDFAQFGRKNNITEYNYIYVIGQKICEQLVADLGLDAKTLAAQRDILNPFKPEQFRDLRKAVDDALPKVIENMKNKK